MIHLEKVTRDNLWAISKLKVNKEQKNFVADNGWSLMQAYTTFSSGKNIYPYKNYKTL